MSSLLRIGLFVALATVAGCDAGAPGGATDQAAQDSVHVDSSAGTIAPLSRPYAVETVKTPAMISGTVEPVDSAALSDRGPTAGACPVANSAAAPAPHPSVVLWVEGVVNGKAPPPDNRYDLESSGCEVDPRTQVVRTGGGVNVFNDDPTEHRLVFIRLGTHDTLQVMPFVKSGQIVATDRLTRKAGIIEVRCVQHPWTRGYLVVLDHPYFAVAAPGDAYRIDSLPPGDYSLFSWREGQSQPAERKVTASTVPR